MSMSSPSSSASRASRQFGHVRSLLHGEPSARSWQALCQALGGMDPQQLPELLEGYVLPQLRSWPDALRVCPQGAKLQRWRERPALYALARSLDVEGYKLEDTLSQPWRQIRELDLTVYSVDQLERAIALLSGAPWLEGLRVLTLRGPHHHTSAALWAQPWARGISALRLAHLGLIDESLIQALLDGAMPNLQELSALKHSSYGQRLPAPLAQQLRRALPWAQLRRLQLPQADEAWLQALERAPATQLEDVSLELDLASGQLPALERWCARGALQGLSSLRLGLHHAYVDQVLVHGLTRAPALRVLELRGELLGRAPKPLAASIAPRLRVLSLKLSHLSEDWIAWIASRVDLSALEQLDLHRSMAWALASERAALARWLQAMSRQALQRLALVGWQLTTQELDSILRLGQWPSCRELILSGNALHQDVDHAPALVQALSDRERFPALERLSLAGCSIAQEHGLLYESLRPIWRSVSL